MFLKYALFSIIFLTMIFPNTIFSQTPPLETGVSQALAKWRTANYSDVRYKLNITLEKGAPLMKGDIEIRVKLTEIGAKNDLILDWRTTQFANDKDKPFANVVQVNNAIDIISTVSKEHLIIPKDALKTGENIIKIQFASPIKTSGAAITRYVDKEDGAEYVYSLFVPSDASTAFPVFDQPDLKARFQLNITAPKGWKAISNTNTGDKFYPAERNEKLRNIIDRTFYFEETKPISTYVFAFAAGEFQSFKETAYFPERELKNLQKENVFSMDIQQKIDAGNEIFVRKSQAEKFKVHAKEIFRLNHEGVKFLEDWFDYKFPFPKYDLVLIPEFPFGGMEHAGATFLREDRVIFPTEPTKNDLVTRANVIFHEAAHQWFGDTVTMKWFDDLWLKEGFAEFMAYKTLEKVMPEYNAWKIFYERNKQAAYLTDVTRGTTPIYQEIPNLASAKSAYGNIVYRKAPSFLRQAEFYLGEKEFQTAVRAFLKKHEFANAEWTDLVKEFETASGKDLKDWANVWVKQPGLGKISVTSHKMDSKVEAEFYYLQQNNLINFDEKFSQKIICREQKVKVFVIDENDEREIFDADTGKLEITRNDDDIQIKSCSQGQFVEPNCKANFLLTNKPNRKFIFPNYQDYGYGIFLLDEKSRAYVLANIQNEKDDFLRSMMWGSLWDAVRFYELAPEDYVKLVIKNINTETDESTIATLLNRVSIAMNYYLSEPPAVAGGLTPQSKSSIANKNYSDKSNLSNDKLKPSATADGSDLQAQIENLLINKIETAPTLGQKITFYRAFLSLASSENARNLLKKILENEGGSPRVSKGANDENKNTPLLTRGFPSLKTKDKFDIVTKLITLGDADGLKLLAELEKTETDDAAKRYAYAAKAGIPTAENKAKYWKDFISNKEISESYIESAFNVWNTPKHAELTLPYLEKSLAELPNLKRTRKIFFINGWLSSFIGGQKSVEALNIVNKFLADNPNLDKDLRNKILENADNLERAVKIREKFGAEK